MAVSQYIGARYVPLFYTASDNSNDWESGVQYDPLTIVTYLNQSYTSRIPVPATVGNPASNPQYWVLTGAYNAQVESYRQDVENYTQMLNDYLTSAAVTPEQFGAAGDGVTDDYQAIADALASGSPVVANNSYYIGTQLRLPYNSTFICHGTVNAPNGLLFNNTDVVCYVKKLHGSGTGSGIVFNVPPADENLGACCRNNVIVGIIDGYDHAIDMYAAINNRGIQYNRIIFDRIINATNAIRLRTVGTRTWINQNQFIGGSIYGGANDLIYTGVLGNAVVTTPGVDETEITSNKFENIVFEGIEDAAVDFTNCTGNMFVDCRMAEEIHGTYWIKLKGSGANIFSGYLNFSVAKIKDEMANDWNNALAYARANRFDFFNLQSGTGTWHGRQGCWSYNKQFSYDNGVHGTYNVNIDDPDYNFNTQFDFSRYSIGNGFKISMQSGGNLTLPAMFKAYMSEIAVFNKGSGSITVKDADGTTLGTITAYGNQLLKWTTGGLLILTA